MSSFSISLRLSFVHSHRRFGVRGVYSQGFVGEVFVGFIGSLCPSLTVVLLWAVLFFDVRCDGIDLNRRVVGLDGLASRRFPILGQGVVLRGVGVLLLVYHRCGRHRCLPL